MIDLTSLEYAFASSSAVLFVISPRDAAKFSSEIRDRTNCPPWQSIENMRSTSGGRYMARVANKRMWRVTLVRVR